MTKKVINELAIWRLQRDEIGKDHADYEFRFNFVIMLWRGIAVFFVFLQFSPHTHSTF